MSLKTQFKTDESLEVKGVVIQYGSSRVRIARAGGANLAYKKSLEKEMKPHRRALAANVMENEQALPILQRVFAKHIVVDWNEECLVDGKRVWVRGINPDDAGQGKVEPEELAESLLPLTPENVLLVFAELPELYADLQEQANGHALFREEVNEEAAGN